jgi:hypothetical protein
MLAVCGRVTHGENNDEIFNLLRLNLFCGYNILHSMHAVAEQFRSRTLCPRHFPQAPSLDLKVGFPAPHTFKTQ